MTHQRQLDNGRGLFLLWLNWIIATGAITLVVVCALWISEYWLPFLAFGLELILHGLVRKNNRSAFPVCYLIPFITTRVLLLSGIIMIVINLMHIKGLIHNFFDPETLNADIPYISLLIVAPITALTALWGTIRNTNLTFCVNCRMRYGSAAERGFLGSIFSQEGHFQIKLLLIMYTFLTIWGWVYYATIYVNVNINSPDRFFFFWAPVLFFILGGVYTGVRYLSLWNYYVQNIEGSASRQGSSTQLRYLVFWDNYILLRVPDPEDVTDPAETKIDTPASLFIPYRKKMTDYDAEYFFNGMWNLQSSDIRFMYSNVNFNYDCNIFHYLSFITDEQKAEVENHYPNCKWLSLQQLDRALSEGKTASLLGSEIYRLYTIAMAWKTYDREGKRLYKIKHYTPTFRIKDIKKWDVDYNDSRWLFIANNNEDKPFYRFKKFWHKYISGLDG